MSTTVMSKVPDGILSGLRSAVQCRGGIQVSFLISIEHIKHRTKISINYNGDFGFLIDRFSSLQAFITQLERQNTIEKKHKKRKYAQNEEVWTFSRRSSEKSGFF